MPTYDNICPRMLTMPQRASKMCTPWVIASKTSVTSYKSKALHIVSFCPHCGLVKELHWCGPTTWIAWCSTCHRELQNNVDYFVNVCSSNAHIMLVQLVCSGPHRCIHSVQPQTHGAANRRVFSWELPRRTVVVLMLLDMIMKPQRNDKSRAHIVTRACVSRETYIC